MHFGVWGLVLQGLPVPTWTGVRAPRGFGTGVFPVYLLSGDPQGAPGPFHTWYPIRCNAMAPKRQGEKISMSCLKDAETKVPRGKMTSVRPRGISQALSGGTASSPESLLCFGGLKPGPERRGGGQAPVGGWSAEAGPPPERHFPTVAVECGGTQGGGRKWPASLGVSQADSAGSCGCGLGPGSGIRPPGLLTDTGPTAS